MTATIPQPLSGAQSLQPLLSLVSADLADAEAVMSRMTSSSVSLIPELAGYLISNGGKRIRMALSLGCAKLMNYRGRRHLSLAAAIEFIHTATLLHDDVVDHSDLRRNKPAAHTIWGNEAAIAVGDFLLSRAFEMLVEDGSIEILQTVSRASGVISTGEVVQLAAQRQIRTSEAEYFEIIGAKTAALFEASCAVIGFLPGGSEAIAADLGRFGQAIGIAFQLTDDALDYASTATRMGKNPGDDFREGKVTLPVILAFARGSRADRLFWEEAMQGLKASDADLAHALHLLTETDAIQDTLERANRYIEDAKEILSYFGDGAAKEALISAADFAVSRGN